MQITIPAGAREGRLPLPPSKSIAHRKIILSALAPLGGEVRLWSISNDIRATLDLVEALGGKINITEKNKTYHIKISPFPKKIPAPVRIHVDESATTMRIALILAPALADHVIFTAGEQLRPRPMDEGIRFLREHGVEVTGPWPIETKGRLTFTDAQITAKTTGQFVTGALLASLTQRRPVTVAAKNPPSAPYIRMTARIMAEAGINIEENNGTYTIHQGDITHIDPVVEGDYSHAAYAIVANAMGSKISLTNLPAHSLQGDQQIQEHIKKIKAHKPVDLTHTPDLLMPLAVLATKTGATFTGIRRLRTKESDRIAATSAMLRALGINTTTTDDSLTVAPGQITSGTVNSCGDHRIAFAAALAATVATGPITLAGAEAVDKSWPGFYESFAALKIIEDK